MLVATHILQRPAGLTCTLLARPYVSHHDQVPIRRKAGGTPTLSRPGVNSSWLAECANVLPIASARGKGVDITLSVGDIDVRRLAVEDPWSRVTVEYHIGSPLLQAKPPGYRRLFLWGCEAVEKTEERAMGKQNGSLNRKFDLMIERLDMIVGLMNRTNRTLERHEESLSSIEGTMKEIRSELLERVVHYGDRIVFHTDEGTTKGGILRA